jgi:hypothetical protein
MEILALLLLRIRDGKTRGIKRNGVLQALAKELISAAKEEGGYPDSDDEEEEDEDDHDDDDENNNNDDGEKKAKKPPKRIINRDDSLISIDDRDSYNPNFAQNNPMHNNNNRDSNAYPRSAGNKPVRSRKRMDLFTK